MLGVVDSGAVLLDWEVGVVNSGVVVVVDCCDCGSVSLRLTKYTPAITATKIPAMIIILRFGNLSSLLIVRLILSYKVFCFGTGIWATMDKYVA